MPFARPEKFGILFTLRFMLRVLVSYNRNQERKTKETVYSPFERKKTTKSLEHLIRVCPSWVWDVVFRANLFFFRCCP